MKAAKNKAIYISAVLCMFVSIISVIHPGIRGKVKGLFHSNSRRILAVANARLDGTDKIYEILKVKNAYGMYLEIYLNGQIIASTKLPDNKDGYFTFSGQVTNLAIDDIDNDFRPEILATSFDEDLVAHINIYRFYPEQKDLSLVRLGDYTAQNE